MYQITNISTTIWLLVLSVFLLQSCENTTSPEFDTFDDFINSIEPIEGADNVTMDLKSDQSQDSYFLVTYSNIEPNPIINNGQKKAWCVEWDVSAVYEVQNNIKLYSTEGTDYWKEINYLLSQTEQLKEQNPNLGWMEMQVAIWSLIGYKDFEIDKIPEYQNMGQFYKDGEYLFDLQLAKSIIEQVKTEATASRNQKFAVIAENAGQTIITRSE